MALKGVEQEREPRMEHSCQVWNSADADIPEAIDARKQLVAQS
jgi:hypothetical protein